MKSIIDSIYDGDIRPAEDILSYSDELQKLYARSARMLTDIRNMLPESQWRIIDEFCEVVNLLEIQRLPAYTCKFFRNNICHIDAGVIRIISYTLDKIRQLSVGDRKLKAFTPVVIFREPLNKKPNTWPTEAPKRYIDTLCATYHFQS